MRHAHLFRGMLSWLTLLVLGLNPPGLAMASGPEPARRPNFVFILADDLGYGDLGCYGQSRIKTPQIDQLAREGRRFTACYAGSTVCAPSRCALLTGVHTGHARVRGNRNIPLRPEDVTLGEVLQDAGYATGMVGKWGLGREGSTGTPNKQGFAEWFGFLDQTHAHNYYPDHLWRNETRETIAGNEVTRGVATRRQQYAPDLFLRASLDFLDQHQREPFLLMVTTTLPHANNERAQREGNGMEIPSDAPYGGESWPAAQRNHAAMITRLDGDVGQILQKLADLGIADNTVVCFTSDNGPLKEGGADPAFFGSSGPLRGFKRALYEGGIRVPMIVRWPGQIPAATASDAPWAFWDVLPTFAELAHAPAPSGIDGRSVVPLLRTNNPPPPHDPLYWEFHERGFSQAIRDGDWKAVRLAPGQPVELYNLQTDIGEAHNIASDHPAEADRLTRLLDSSRIDSTDFPIRP